jgi:hypothetical protein
MTTARIHKVEHKKLGRHQVHGFAYFGKNKIEVDERLKGYPYLLTMLHEHYHLQHPEWSETKVRTQSSKTARFLWQNNFRWVDIK